MVKIEKMTSWWKSLLGESPDAVNPVIFEAMKRMLTLILLASLDLLGLGCQRSLMKVPEVLSLPASEGIQIPYGADSLQFGELRVPAGEGPFPLVAIIHGGCWLAAYDLGLMDAMATDLTARGYATWNLEYRRVGDAGGGWPGTFLDIAHGVDHLQTLTEDYPLDLEQLVVVGHSAGGHLALWAGSRGGLPRKSPLYTGRPLQPQGVISLAGIVDLEDYFDPNSGCGSSIDDLMGGTPSEVPERYRQTSPVFLPLMNVPRILLTGTRDPIVPTTHVNRYLTDRPDPDGLLQAREIRRAGHFEVISPGSRAWPEVVQALEDVLFTIE